MNIRKLTKNTVVLDIEGEQPIWLTLDELQGLLFVVSTFLMDLENTEGDSNGES